MLHSEVSGPNGGPPALGPPQADPHRFLQMSIESDREQAWSIARYQREQSDKLTSQIRFGLTAVNAASLVTVLNLGHSLEGVGATAIAWSAMFFLLGTLFAGCSLLAQQNHEIIKAGNANARAITLNHAVSLSKYPPQTPEYGRLREATDEAHTLNMQTFQPSYYAIALQSLGMGMWIGGAIAVAWPALVVVSPTMARLSALWPF